jgi:hypothetical protein
VDVRPELEDVLSPLAALGLPIGWALISGLVAGTLAGFWAVLSGAGGPLDYGLVAGFAVFGLAWLRGLAWWRGLIRSIVAPIPEPSPELYRVETVRVELMQENGEAGAWLDLPIDRGRLVELCKGIEAGSTFSLASFGGRGKLLSRSEFEGLRDEFIKRGLARWVSPHAHNRGLELTGSGRALIRTIGRQES